MTTTTRNSYKLSLKRATKRTTRRRHPQNQKTTTSSSSSTTGSSLFNKPMHHARKYNNNNNKLSQKLEALKNLIPTHNEETVKPDQLFKKTADYIVLLRTRVVVLQKLIEYYDGNNNINNINNDEHAVLL